MPIPISIMKTRSQFDKTHIVSCSGTITADDFEDKVIHFYQSKTNTSEPLLLDFADAEYINISTLININAFTLGRREKNQETYISVPRSKPVRDFLRVWRFPEAFKDATGVSFEELLVKEDQMFRGEPQNTYRGIGTAIDALEYNPDWGKNQHGRRNFFEFMSYSPKETPAASIQPGAIAKSEGLHWNGDLINEVLKTYLVGVRAKEDMSRVVIYETLSNSVRHPDARVIQSVSRIVRPKGIPSQLRVSVWDDGQGIISTLKPLIEKGLAIRSVRPPDFPEYMYDRIFVRVRPWGGSYDNEQEVNQGEDPSPSTPDHIILLSSLYPGISRSVSVPVRPVERFDEESSTTFHETVIGGQSQNALNFEAKSTAPKEALASKAGMGLYALTRAVVDRHTGSLILRTGRYSLQLELSHDTYTHQHQVRYKAKITVFPEEYPSFKGNLLTIELPASAPVTV